MQELKSKSELLKLLLICPKEERSESCALYDQKDSPEKALVEWVTSLSSNEVKMFQDAHSECMTKIVD